MAYPTKAEVEIAKTIAGEAWGEGYIGMYAVACVIQNRAKIAYLRPRSIIMYGFAGRVNKVALQGYKVQKKWLLKLVYTLNRLQLKDITNGALYFESIDFPRNVKEFDKKYQRCWQYKKHIFYKDKEVR